MEKKIRDTVKLYGEGKEDTARGSNIQEGLSELVEDLCPNLGGGGEQDEKDEIVAVEEEGGGGG